ncbi:MAG: hypothetical protein V1787_05175 [Candidatus Micrarchaeota archaeon]
MAGVFVWLLMRLVLGHDGFGNGLMVALVALVLLPYLAEQSAITFLVILAVGGLAVQQVYRTSFPESVLVTLVAMVVGSMLIPLT